MKDGEKTGAWPKARQKGERTMLRKVKQHSSFFLWNGTIFLALACSVVLMGLPVINPALHDAHGAALLLVATALVLGMFHLHQSWHRITQRDELYIEARTRTDELFAMTDMLQSADGYGDATAVLMATSQRLLPQFGTALYVFNNSRDRLDLTGSWNTPEGYVPSDTLNPANCWALKRGKFHINDPRSNTLCCAHHGSHVATIEIPMMARGSVYGLLMLASDAPDAQQQLRTVQRLGRALADSMLPSPTSAFGKSCAPSRCAIR